MCVVGRTILLVGVHGRHDALTELPVRVLAFDTGARAIRCLKEEQVDAVISRWDLIDVVDGMFLKRVTEAKLSMPTIAFIRPCDVEQEITARSLGVDVVLQEDVTDEYFTEVVSQLLGASAVSSLHLADTGADGEYRAYGVAMGTSIIPKLVTNN